MPTDPFEPPKEMGTCSDVFVGYVGDPDFHDGVIVRVGPREHQVLVVIRGASGCEYVVEFHGVKVIRLNKPEGMTLFAMTEMRTATGTRRFVFANWNYEDDARLEVEAEGFSVTLRR